VAPHLRLIDCYFHQVDQSSPPLNLRCRYLTIELEHMNLSILRNEKQKGSLWVANISVYGNRSPNWPSRQLHRFGQDAGNLHRHFFKWNRNNLDPIGLSSGCFTRMPNSHAARHNLQKRAMANPCESAPGKVEEGKATG
jgi:hypothetical protein